MDNLLLGATCVTRLYFSAEDVQTFISLSGDTNIIHLDPDAAAKSPLKKLAIHGTLCAAKLSGIHGTRFPGHGTVYRWVRYDWYVPMVTDLEYEATITVIEIKPERHRGVIRTVITESSGDVVAESTAEVVHLMLF